MSELPPPPPPPAVPLPGQEPFQTNKGLAIVAIVVGALTCGCLTLLLGILGLVFANKAQTLWSGGDVNGAASAASTARILSIIGFVLAVVWIVIFVIGWTTGSFNFNSGM